MNKYNEFNILDRKKGKGQKFEKPIIKQYGKEICLYDKIQMESEDTEIYKVLDKYNCLDKIKIDKQKVFTDITEIENEDKFDIYTKQEKMREIWQSLPLEIRNEAKNDIKNLESIAKNWLKKQAESKIEQKIEPKTETKTETIGDSKNV